MEEKKFDDNECYTIIKETLGFEVKEVKGFSRQQIVQFDESKDKVYAQAGGITIGTFLNICKKIDSDGLNINYCLFGRRKKVICSCWYWADFKTWRAYAEKLKKDHGKKEGDTMITDSLKDEKSIASLQNPQSCEREKKNEFIQKIKEDLQIDMLKDQLVELILKADAKQIICHGAPGTGKTYTIRETLNELLNEKIGKLENVENFVQFHPSYDYTDFIEGLRPVYLKTDASKTDEGTPSFVRLDGIFKKFCREVINEENKEKKEKKYIFIIDEINRADLSKVFGELMYCLEENNRGADKNIPTQYSNLPCYEIKDGQAIQITKNTDVFEKGFYIPENIIIIGTMNDIDRSVDSFDFAMQRRFSWINVKADTEMTIDVLAAMFKKSLEKTGGAIPAESLARELKKHAKALNEEIGEKLGEEYKIGHAYYKKFAIFYADAAGNNTDDNLDDKAFKRALNKVWDYSLEQILSSYLRGKKHEKLKNFENIFKTLTNKE